MKRPKTVPPEEEGSFEYRVAQVTHGMEATDRWVL